jgi:hypothetical protein
VKRRYKISIILLLAMLVSVFTAEVDCVAKLCADGAVRNLCYIDVPFSQADLECQAPTAPPSGAAIGPAGGRDNLSEVSYPASLAGSRDLSLSRFLSVFLAPAPDLEALLLAEAIARPLDSRGPPLAHPSLRSPSLRAPPIA